MSDPNPNTGAGPGPPDLSVSPPSPQQPSLTYAKALGGAAGVNSNLMKYAEIVAQQKAQRNVLEVKINKVNSNHNNENERPIKSLNMDDISELVFGVSWYKL